MALNHAVGYVYIIKYFAGTVGVVKCRQAAPAMTISTNLMSDQPRTLWSTD